MYTKHKLVLLALFLFVGNVSCDKNENATEVETKLAGKSRQLLYAELVTCAVRYDMSCIVSVAEDYLEVKRNELLAEADREVIKATGRADSENSPSKLAKSIEKLLSDLSGLFKNGFMGLFKEGENDEVEETENEEEDPKEGAGSRDVNGAKQREARKKENGILHRLVNAIVKAVYAAILGGIIFFLLKFYYAGLAALYYLIAKGYFILKAIKTWWWIKQSGHKSEQVVHYEVAHHSIPEHHHEEHVHYDHDGHHYPYWGKEDRAHDLAYHEQKPDESMFYK